MSARGWGRSSLRVTLSVVTLVLTALALVVAATLVGLTSYLLRTTELASTSVQSVRAAQEAEINLLLHGRAKDALARRELEAELRRQLAIAARHVAEGEEEHVLRQAAGQLEEYIMGARQADATRAELLRRNQEAYQALEALVDVNVAQADEALARATRWSRLGPAFAFIACVSVTLLSAWLLWWLWGQAFRPAVALLEVMERFGRGDRNARAEEIGSRELRDLAGRFNELAAAVSAQRQSLMAFLAGMAHDLRNPLSALRISVNAVGPGGATADEPRLRRTLEVLDRQLLRLERMTDDFLDMVKLEAGRLELHFETHDARVLLHEVLALFEGTSPRHQLRLSVPDEAVPVVCDGLRIEQVVTNLVSNAIKYSPEGGPIELTVEVQREVVLRVRDHGVGIPPDEQEQLFEPFRRGSGAAGVPGLGLGLFVVRGIVEAHGGRIEVQSAPGRGATFCVILPVTTAPDASASALETRRAG